MYSPKYNISNNILKNIGVIEACREVIKNAPLVPSWERKFQEEAIVRQVHHGTHLEGNPLNISEAAKVVAGEKIIGRARDLQEVINYRNVLDFISKTVKKDEKFDEKLIKKLHKLATEKILPFEKSGVLRKTQVVIRNSQTGEISFKPPPAVEVPYLLEEFLDWLNSKKGEDTHSVIRSAITQYEVVRIHPFVDGNGRVARALATLILYKEKYDIRRFFSLEEYYDRSAEEYYKALQSVSKQEDLTLWLEYFTKGLAIELTRIKEKVKKLSVDIHLKERLGGRQLFLNDRQIKIVEYVQNVGYLQNKMFKELFPMISEDTILRELQDLIKKGIMVKKGKTKGAKYTLKK